jgi:predicted short-subunit dehydrogenase-like oxidoreductase (DUF2520 family)
LINSNPKLLLIKGGPGKGRRPWWRCIASRICSPRDARAKIATCYDKLAIVSRAAVLHAVIAWTKRLSDTPVNPPMKLVKEYQYLGGF